MSNDEKFKKGDVVMLKSGGPHMTVANCDDPKIILCQWFAGEEAKEDYFPEESLKIAEKSGAEEGE